MHYSPDAKNTAAVAISKMKVTLERIYGIRLIDTPSGIPYLPSAFS